MLRNLGIMAIICLLAASRAAAIVTWNVTVNDQIGGYNSLYSTIIAHCQLAGQTWSNKIVTAANASIEVEVDIKQTPSNRGGGSSNTGFFVGTNGGINVFEQGTARELKSGIDPNGATPDITIELDPDYIDTQLWWDPNPAARTATVPNNRIDDMSVWLHELGHAIAFNGWKDWTTAQLPAGSGESPFDALISVTNSIPFFNGPAAKNLYGGPVPLTYGNLFHFGNKNGLGAELAPDLMNGIVFNWGQRYYITPLDLAALQDSGVPVTAIPEPATLGSLVLAFVGMRVQRRT